MAINDRLICPDCGWVEEKPFDEGDECICGGRFIFQKREEPVSRYEPTDEVEVD